MWSNTPNFMEAPRGRTLPRVRPQSTRPILRPARGHLAPLDLLDLVGLGSARRHHLDARALALADERTGERRRDRDLSLLGVGLRLADKLPHLLFVGILVDQGHRRAECDGIARELRHIDDLGPRELVLEFGDAGLV